MRWSATSTIAAISSSFGDCSALPAGEHLLVVYAHTAVNNSWVAATRLIYVDAPAATLLIDRAGPGTGAIASSVAGLSCSGGASTVAQPCESLTQGAASLRRLKGGMRMGTVAGDGDAIFRAISSGGRMLPNGRVMMADGTFIGKHIATWTGEFTIEINRAGQAYKIRVTR